MTHSEYSKKKLEPEIQLDIPKDKLLYIVNDDGIFECKYYYSKRSYFNNEKILHLFILTTESSKPESLYDNELENKLFDNYKKAVMVSALKK